MDNVEINGQDVRLVYQTGQRLVERARAGEGPAFLLCRTYRFRGHHVGDIDRPYRSREEEEKWQTENDPLKILSDWLVSDKMVELDLFSQIEDEVRSEVEAAVTFALNASFPDEMEVDAHVYA
jgi:pyruvate dehydrogenase E1 component alpha subunit